MDLKDLFSYTERDERGCWNWTRRSKQNGYGVAYLGKERWLAHRAAYTLVKGAIPEGMSVCHSCDNPACINPDHLWLGTHKENMHDAIKKGRSSKPPVHVGEDHWRHKYPEMVERGEDNPNAIKTDEEVIALRRDYVAGTPLSDLYVRYQVTKATIHDYTSGRSWKHLLGIDGSPTLEELKQECARRRRNNSRLTQEDIPIIRKRLAAGEFCTVVAQDYGVSKMTIWDIKHHRTWR